MILSRIGSECIPPELQNALGFRGSVLIYIDTLKHATYDYRQKM